MGRDWGPWINKMLFQFNQYLMSIYSVFETLLKAGDIKLSPAQFSRRSVRERDQQRDLRLRGI